MKKTKKAKKVKRTEKTPQKTYYKPKSQQVVVRVEAVATTPTIKDLEPVQDGGKYMIPKTWMSEKQVVRLVQKTPPQHIYTRPGKGGQTFTYVTGHYVEKVLNYAFGWNWDFEIVAHGREGSQVWVQGKLTVKDDRNHTITKSQFGRADIKFLKGTKDAVDFGNDLKAASTDAMKKCASLLGIASDIYGKAEYKQEAKKEVVEEQVVQIESPKSDLAESLLKEGQIIGPDGQPTWACEVCGDPIADQVAEFSKKFYKKHLCREDQPKKK